MKWIKSSFCNFGNCCEVTDLGYSIAVRNSKARTAGTVYFSATEWTEFVRGVKAGEFDFDAPAVLPEERSA
jgi:hypothetical protein